jgi:hypothetical protein
MSLLRSLFARSRQPVPSRRRRSVRPGVESLESRAMLAADDIIVSLVGNQVVLTLDPAGTAITNLSTAYASKAGVLTITAASAGTLSAAAPIPGITINPAADTIAVNLNTIPKFAGISVLGGEGSDLITIGPGGVNLAAVTRGAARQSLSIDTGAGLADAVVVANPVAAKGAGSVNFTTAGQATEHGIILAANVTAPTGSQTFAGSVTLDSNVTVTAGTTITFASTVDGSSRLMVSAGGPVFFAGAVGGSRPLAGMTLARAAAVGIADAFVLDGTSPAW